VASYRSGVRWLSVSGKIDWWWRETADPSTSLPRISCGTWWRWCTSCAFPLQKGAHAALSNAAWQEIRVRFGRDDTGDGGVLSGDWFVDAGNSRSLRFGRDDNSVWVLRFDTENSGGPRGALQIPPLRYASVGMTKVGAVRPFGFAAREGEQQVPPLRSG
jgi:hypothetical protein